MQIHISSKWGGGTLVMVWKNNSLHSNAKVAVTQLGYVLKSCRGNKNHLHKLNLVFLEVNFMFT